MYSVIVLLVILSVKVVTKNVTVKGLSVDSIVILPCTFNGEVNRTSFLLTWHFNGFHSTDNLLLLVDSEVGNIYPDVDGITNVKRVNETSVINLSLQVQLQRFSFMRGYFVCSVVENFTLLQQINVYGTYILHIIYID